MEEKPIEPIFTPGTVAEELTRLGITPRPCPPWCTTDSHFGSEPVVLFAEDGFYHHGPTTTFTDSTASIGVGGNDEQLLLGLSAWTPTLAAEPGSTHIQMSDGGDVSYAFTPDRARQLAAELIRLAETAETTRAKG